MITGRQHINVRFIEFLDDLPCYAETGCGILTVGDDQIDFPPAHKRRQQLFNRPASGLADDVADEKNFHYSLT